MVADQDADVVALTNHLVKTLAVVVTVATIIIMVEDVVVAQTILRMITSIPTIAHRVVTLLNLEVKAMAIASVAKMRLIKKTLLISRVFLFLLLVLKAIVSVF